jgi:hypothetical protein
LAESARCTSVKFVVQYPNESTKPSPKTMPTQSPSGLDQGMPVPFQVLNELAPRLVCATARFRPLQPPTWTRPTTTTGISPARITKNCNT